jgi:hypothetical protein
VGVPGTVAVATGVAVTEAEAGLDPTAFRAVAAHVYVAPGVSPSTVIGLAAPEAVTVVPAVVQAAVYPVIALPPVDAGAEKPSVMAATPAVAVTFCGALGAVAAAAGVTDSGADAMPVPTALVALTAQP